MKNELKTTFKTLENGQLIWPPPRQLTKKENEDFNKIFCDKLEALKLALGKELDKLGDTT